MLTKELLEVTKYKPNIHPLYREIDEYRDVTASVIQAYETGATRGEIEERVSDQETHDTFKLVRGLSKLLDRRSTFEQEAAVSPGRLRERAFERGYVTSQAEREDLMEDIAEELDVSVSDVEQSLWADLEKNEVLVSTPDIEPETLLKEYNLSLTQTLLFDALELTFNVSDNYQEIFGLMKYLGLMYTVDSDLNVTVTGPAALFKKTRKYGTTLAKLVPSIMKAEEWRLSAKVETEVSDETRVYEFDLDSARQGLFPEQTSGESYDSDVERDFSVRIDSLADGWEVKREPTILRAGNRVMIPDFSFERDGHEFYLEVVGFWTPGYLEDKLEKVRSVTTEKPMLLAVNESLNCTKEDFAGADEVFFYDETIPVKPVVQHLNEIDKAIIEEDLATLEETSLDLPDGGPVSIDSLAASNGVEPEAVEHYLEENYRGAISRGTYLPERAMEELKSRIEEVEDPVLSDVNPHLEEFGVGQDVLEKLGYSVLYTTLNQDEARIRQE